jgi:hypothetical protein
MSWEKVNQLWAKKWWIIGGTFGLVFGISAGMVIFTLISGMYFLDGGFDTVVQFWKNNGEGYSDSWIWGGLVGIPLGAGVGVLVWRWLMPRTGLLTPEEMDEIMGSGKK